MQEVTPAWQCSWCWWGRSRTTCSGLTYLPASSWSSAGSRSSSLLITCPEESRWGWPPSSPWRRCSARSPQPLPGFRTAQSWTFGKSFLYLLWIFIFLLDCSKMIFAAFHGFNTKIINCFNLKKAFFDSVVTKQHYRLTLIAFSCWYDSVNVTNANVIIAKLTLVLPWNYRSNSKIMQSNFTE